MLHKCEDALESVVTGFVDPLISKESIDHQQHGEPGYTTRMHGGPMYIPGPMHKTTSTEPFLEALKPDLKPFAEAFKPITEELAEIKLQAVGTFSASLADV